MRKIFTVVLIFILASLSACRNPSSVPRMEEYPWTLSSVQSADKNGKVIAYGSAAISPWPDAIFVELECTAADGKLTVTNLPKGEDVSGTYAVSQISPDSIIYDVTLGNRSGKAVVAMTTYHDQTQTPTLIFNLDDIILNFFAVQKG